MGYFSNGTDGAMFEEEYCNNCVHEKIDSFCPVMEAHQLYNYDDCNNKNSILHILIPRDEKGYNQPCAMFIKKEDVVNG
jgi:hypothetical protein